ncbi:MAG: hypothetical protein ACYDGR_03615 [Candidatus Dormibacteria bacterium]
MTTTVADLDDDQVMAFRLCIARDDIGILEAHASADMAAKEYSACGDAEARLAAAWWLGVVAVLEFDWRVGGA